MKRKQTDRDRERIMMKGAWRARIGGTRLNKLSLTPAFHKVVALMRVVNQIRFVNLAALQSDHTDAPADRRQINQSFFFECALMFEGWNLAARLRAHYHERESFRDGLGALLKDREAQDFLSQRLKPLRNAAMFHADEDEIGRRLPDFHKASMIVLSGLPDTNALETYYDLADVVMNLTFVGPVSSAEEFKVKDRAALMTFRALVLRFLQGADDLIVDLLSEARAQFESVKLTRVPAEGRPAMARALERVMSQR